MRPDKYTTISPNGHAMSFTGKAKLLKMYSQIDLYEDIVTKANIDKKKIIIKKRNGPQLQSQNISNFLAQKHTEKNLAGSHNCIYAESSMRTAHAPGITITLKSTIRT